MTFQLAVGDIATRLARGLGIRGRVQIGLGDHVAMPTVKIADVDQPPFADLPHRFANYMTEGALGAGIYSATQIGYVGETRTIVVDRVHCWQGTCAGWLQRGNAPINLTGGSFFAQWINAPQGIQPTGFNINSPLVCRYGQLAFPSANALLFLLGAYDDYRGPLVLWPGDALYLVSGTTNTAVNANITGRWYDNL